MNLPTNTTPVRRSVRIVLLNDSNRILLMKVVLPDRSFWCTLGGGVKKGESPAQAVRRELFEETGLGEGDVATGPLIWEGEHVLPRDGIPTLHQESFFLCRTSSARICTDHMTDEEQAVVTAMRWWSVEEMRQTREVIVPPGLAELLAELIEQGPSPACRRIPLGDRP